MYQDHSPELVREFVIASHGDFGKVKSILSEHPGLLNTSHAWSETDRETAIMAAAHVGNRSIAEFLIERGAPLAICTAAMLGEQESVTGWLAQDAVLIHAHGAHMIPLLAHAALSGRVDLMEMLVARGAREGESFALHNAVSFGHQALACWLLENTTPDLGWKNWDERTALAVAVARGDEGTQKLLRQHGAQD